MITDPTSRASPEAPVDASDTAPSRDDEEETPAGDPEYSDLLDAEWLERAADARERDDDLIDVGLTLDLTDRDDVDELAQALDLDVGVLLTSLPAQVSRDRGSPEGGSAEGFEAEREIGDGSLSLGALRDVLLPEERAVRERAEDDEEVGDDERFPAFESSIEPRPRASEEDSSEGEA